MLGAGSGSAQNNAPERVAPSRRAHRSGDLSPTTRRTRCTFAPPYLPISRPSFCSAGLAGSLSAVGAICVGGRWSSTRGGIDVPRRGLGRPSRLAPAARRGAGWRGQRQRSSGDRGRRRPTSLVENTAAAPTSVQRRCFPAGCVDVDASRRAFITADVAPRRSALTIG
jgi:hypothetical protein